MATQGELLRDPAAWGITLRQILAVAEEPAFRPNMNVYQVVDEIVKPRTLALGRSWALMTNASRPLHATRMVSHAWNENFLDLTAALKASGVPEDEPLWVCAFSIYQNNGSAAAVAAGAFGPTIGDQLGADVNAGPFAQVIAEAAVTHMHCVLTPGSFRGDDWQSGNIYSRAWCVLEMAHASLRDDLVVEVNVAPPQDLIQSFLARRGRSKGASVLQRGAEVLGEHERRERIVAALTEDIDTRRATCSDAADQAAIRSTIARIGFDVVDRRVRKLRAQAALGLYRGGLVTGALGTSVAASTRTGADTQAGARIAAWGRAVSALLEPKVEQFKRELAESQTQATGDAFRLRVAKRNVHIS